MRRSTFSDVPVTYGAVGGTQAPDLMRYPPHGYRPIEREARLGSGHERFDTAREALFEWGVQRGAGMSVNDVQVADGDTYHPVDFDDEGEPVRAAALESDPVTTDSDGVPRIAAGVTATLRTKVGPFHSDAPVRVVYVIDELRTAGFAYGTLPGHPLRGEEAFVVQHRDDDTVWLVVRAFSRPSGWMRALPPPILTAIQARLTTKYLRALLPGRAS